MIHCEDLGHVEDEAGLLEDATEERNLDAGPVEERVDHDHAARGGLALLATSERACNTLVATAPAVATLDGNRVLCPLADVDARPLQLDVCRNHGALKVGGHRHKVINVIHHRAHNLVAAAEPSAQLLGNRVAHGLAGRAHHRDVLVEGIFALEPCSGFAKGCQNGHKCFLLGKYGHGAQGLCIL